VNPFDDSSTIITRRLSLVSLQVADTEGLGRQYEETGETLRGFDSRELHG